MRSQAAAVMQSNRRKPVTSGRPKLSLVREQPKLKIEIAHANKPAFGNKVSGDVVKVDANPEGVRFLLGDVMGKGKGTQLPKKQMIAGFKETTGTDNSLVNFVRKTDAGVAGRFKRSFFLMENSDIRRNNALGNSDEKFNLKKFKRIFGDMHGFATGIIGSINRKREMSFYNVTHPNFFLLRDEEVIKLPRDNFYPLGLNHKKKIKCPTKLLLKPNDLILIASDGVTEHRNDKNDFFGEERLLSTLNKNKHLPPSVIRDKIFKKLSEHNPKLHDDTSILVMRIH